MSILHADSAPVNSDGFPVDLVSEADRAWWAELTANSAWWLDLLEDNVADSYGEFEPFDRDDDDDVIIDKHLANHGYPPELPDECYIWNGHPG